MANLTTSLIVRVLDQASGPARAIAASLRGITAAANSVGGLTNFNRQLEQISNRSKELGKRASEAVLNAALPAAIGVSKAYQTALEFSKELNKATAIGELTEDQRRSVAQTAREIGASTQFTASQALSMQRALVAAGRTVEQAQGMTRPILNAALFGDTDPFTAAKGIIAITSAFRLQMRTTEEARQQATRVGDLVAKAANESVADFQDILQGFKYAAPIAYAAGWSMEQLSAALAHMANNGLRGDEAGVALRSMLVRLVRPTRDARQAMAELGLSFDQFFGKVQQFDIKKFASGMANTGHRLSKEQQQVISNAVAKNAALPEGQQVDLGQVLTDAMIGVLKIPEKRTQDRQKIARAVQQYATSLAESVDPDALFKALQEAGVTPGQMARIFDTRQGSRLMTLLGPEYENVLKKIVAEADGASERGARQMERGLYGAHKRIQSALESIVLAVAESGVAERIAEIMDKISEGFRALAGVDPAHLRAVGYALLGIAAAAPVGFAAFGIAAGLKVLAGAGGLLFAMFSPVGAVIATVTAAIAGLAVYAYKNWDGLSAGIGAFAKVISERFPVIGQAIEWVSNKISDLISWFGQITGKSSASTAEWEAWGTAAAQSVIRVIDKLSEFVAYIAGLPGRITSALGDAGSLLYNWGAQLIQGLIDGIKNKVNELLGYVTGIGSRIRGALGGAGGGVSLPAPAAPSVSGARAMGGPVSRGNNYLVGEKGPEIFTANRSGTIIPNGAGGGGGNTISVEFNPTIHVSGGDAEDTAKKVRDQLESMARDALRSVFADAGLRTA